MADPYNEKLKKRYVFDLVERVTWTFAEAFLAVWWVPAALDAGGVDIWDYVVDTSMWEKGIMAGIAAVLALIKGFAAKFIGAPFTAATLPRTEDTPHA